MALGVIIIISSSRLRGQQLGFVEQPVLTNVTLAAGTEEPTPRQSQLLEDRLKALLELAPVALDFLLRLGPSMLDRLHSTQL